MKTWKAAVRIDANNNHKDAIVTANSERKAIELAEAKYKALAKSSKIIQLDQVKVTHIERITDDGEE